MACKRIIIILDASGSMQSQKNDIIGSVNNTILEQRAAMPNDTSTLFSVVTFNDQVHYAPTEWKLSNVPFLTNKTYVTQGSTALCDAIGRTLSKYHNESDVICVIVTDGEENASHFYNHATITTLINQYKDTKNWNFIYLSEDVSTFQQGKNIGIDTYQSNCNNLMSSKGKMGSVVECAQFQNAIKDMRTGSKNVKIAQSCTASGDPLTPWNTHASIPQPTTTPSNPSNPWSVSNPWSASNPSGASNPWSASSSGSPFTGWINKWF